MNNELLKKYVSIVPTAVQKNIQEMGFYSFIHFGINTFIDAEWSDGKESPQLFNPINLNCNQWCEALSAAGATGVILTAKHHDGFCLWQTKTTEYSVKNSPWKNGKGDVVQELRNACDKFGLKLGIYLSPWDRNSEYYATSKYNDFYIEQLKELLTNYGEIFNLWLDGACGSHMDGKPVQEYDFDRYYALVRDLQPNCAISTCGPDVRWVGNEGGFCRRSEWNVVPAFNAGTQKIMGDSQKDKGGLKANKRSCISVDLGSRKILKNYDEFIWYPAEVDVSIRPGWFYHSVEDDKVRSVDDLLNIYYSSTGGNAMLLLNVPPNKDGLFHITDCNRLKELGARLKSAFKNKIDYVVDNISPLSIGDLKDLNNSTISMKLADSYDISVKFDQKSIDKVLLKEDINYSQRVEKFIITSYINGHKKRLYSGTIIGGNKIVIFKKPVLTDNLVFTIQRCRLEPYLKTFEIYETDNNLPKKPKFFNIKRRLEFNGARLWEKDQAIKKAKLAKKTN